MRHWALLFLCYHAGGGEGAEGGPGPARSHRQEVLLCQVVTGTSYDTDGCITRVVVARHHIGAHDCVYKGHSAPRLIWFGCGKGICLRQEVVTYFAAFTRRTDQLGIRPCHESRGIYSYVNAVCISGTQKIYRKRRLVESRRRKS